MLLADTLSRMPNPENKEEIPLDLRMDHIDICLINFASKKQQQLLEEMPATQFCRNWSRWFMPDGQQPSKNCRWTYCHTGHSAMSCAQNLVSSARDDKSSSRPVWRHSDILQQQHTGHQGISKTQRWARYSVYWINFNKEIERMWKSCQVCQEYQEEQRKAPLFPYPTPSRPWQSISSDIFSISDKSYLMVVDRFSKYPLVAEFKSLPTSRAVAEVTKHYCAIFGWPDMIISDNGTQYTGSAYQEFICEWNIDHITSSPNYPRSNRPAERHVRHVKSLIKKAIKSHQDIQIVLMNILATKTDEQLPSPAEIL